MLSISFQKLCFVAQAADGSGNNSSGKASRTVCNVLCGSMWKVSCVLLNRCWSYFFKLVGFIAGLLLLRECPGPLRAVPRIFLQCMSGRCRAAICIWQPARRDCHCHHLHQFHSIRASAN